VSRGPDLRACGNGVTPDFSPPGKPTGDAFGAAFDGRLGAE
jgi:hypothetical protein